jgi:hypothetical protein
MMQTEGGRGIKGRLSIRDAGLPFVLPQNSRDYLKRVRRVWIEFTMRHWINPFSPSRLQYLDHYEKSGPSDRMLGVAVFSRDLKLIVLIPKCNLHLSLSTTQGDVPKFFRMEVK